MPANPDRAARTPAPVPDARTAAEVLSGPGRYAACRYECARMDA
jgi:hypothetical protein